MDLPEPPRVVFEQPAPCADAGPAEVLLKRALTPSVAPHGGWTLTMRVTRDGQILHAEGEITDEAEAPVAHRAFDKDDPGKGSSTQPGACSALAKAVGVWASLVLDSEVQRAQALPELTQPPPPPPPAAPPWPAPAQQEKPSPESELFLAHPVESRSAEIGAGCFLMGGTGAGAVAGPTLFAVIETGLGWFLRPQLAVGRTLQELASSGDVYGTWGATHFDACKRLPGNYLERRGIQLDLCGGTDLGFLRFDNQSDVPERVSRASGQTLAFFALGPSVGLRGELASDLSVTLRAAVEVNMIRETFPDEKYKVEPALFVGRGEFGLTWRLR